MKGGRWMIPWPQVCLVPHVPLRVLRSNRRPDPRQILPREPSTILVSPRPLTRSSRAPFLAVLPDLSLRTECPHESVGKSLYLSVPQCFRL